MRTSINRRDFLLSSLAATAGLSLTNMGCQEKTEVETEAELREPVFNISLAEWSLRERIFSDKTKSLIAAGDWAGFGQLLMTDPDSAVGGEIDHLDFAKAARGFGIEAVEYVNTFFFSKAQDTAYLQEMKSRADGEGVVSLLIMCDALGNLGDSEESARTQAVENHYPWVEAAALLGCHSIRVNAASVGTYEEQQSLAADGLRRLCEFADGHGVNVIVENHGGLSSNGQWLSGVMNMVDHPRVGTLPDFANFQISAEPEEWYDRYQGMEELMPFAKAVSAKSHSFDAEGNETATDYFRMMKIVLDAGYRGYVGIEYEGMELSPEDGIVATKTLLERAREELSPLYV